ncbi:hypothetical protein AB7M22_005212 [Pseudomonas sp. ADAK2 TE3594]|uniref:hypothetical protein n=1 Tax=unclassified Pseudomonas TaxID=196821 RepID=UPI00026F8037|nr:hypothetical protein [Pseudomonas sp. GM102]EJM08345.1 hypothetical protein PMI18_00204 [Pseudomonas sp. GM102]
MIWLKRFLMVVGALSLLVALGVIFFMDFSKDKPHLLSEYPNSHWRGGADGGQYIEVTKSEPPYYFVQVRHESGELWDEGWLKFGDENSEPLTANSVIAFSGEGVIYLQQRKVLSSDKAKAK